MTVRWQVSRPGSSLPTTMNFNDMYVVTELCILREKGDLVYWVRKSSNKKRTEQRLQNWCQKGKVWCSMHPPGVEPGARPWEDPMLPLHHECNNSQLLHIDHVPGPVVIPWNFKSCWSTKQGCYLHKLQYLFHNPILIFDNILFPWRSLTNSYYGLPNISVLPRT